MKTEVYTWRVSADLKSSLEREARSRKVPVSAILDLAAREWLKASTEENDGEAEQQRLHRAAASCLGTIAGGDPGRSENVRRNVRLRLGRNRGR
jgi:hypothetical protein